MRILIVLFVAAFLFSCEKKELPVPKHTVGESIITQVDMNSDYKNQIWFSLSQNKIIYKNLKTDWDISFESAEAGNHIMLNGSRAMRAFKTTFNSLQEVTDTLGLGVNGKADMPSGKLDSTAFGNWQADNKVYIINRGYNELGQHTGFYKIKITNATVTNYSFEYGDVFGQQVFQGTVAKDASYNFIGFSFTTNKAAYNIEPDKQTYDLCFTNYTHLFYDPFQYYQVTGVLTNSYKTRSVKVTDKSFNEITLNDTLGRNFNTNRNNIGYDWKSFDLNTNLYTVYPKMCYIIMDSKGFYYKLHFIDFYNSTGIKGAPKFEFSRL